MDKEVAPVRAKPSLRRAVIEVLEQRRLLAAPYEANVVADGPLGYWRLGEASGSTAVDVIGARDGAYVNVPSLAQAGALTGDPDTAVALNGSDEKVTIPGFNVSSSFTVEAWVKPTVNQEDGFVLGKRGGANDAQPTLRLIDGYVMLETTLSGSGFTWDTVKSATQLAGGQWYHLVGTYDGARLKLYVNGTAEADVAGSGTVATSTYDWAIGAISSAHGADLAAAVDEVAIYGHALGASRVTAHHSAGTIAAPQVLAPPVYPPPWKPPGPDGHFHFQHGPQHLEVDFDQPVTVANGALALSNLTTGTPYTDLSMSGSGAAYIWTVTGADQQGVVGGPAIAGALPRGNYEVLVNDHLVTNADGQTLDGNTYVDDSSDTVGGSGDDYLHSFFFAPGDLNHDRQVDAGDYGLIDNYVQVADASGYAKGDTNYSNTVTQADYAIMDAWVGTALPPPPTAANTLTAAAGRGFVDLYWTPPQDLADIDGYGLWVSEDAGDTFTFLQFVDGAATTTWRHSGLADGTKYTYRIRAHSASSGYALTTNKYWTVTNLPGPLEAPVVSDVAADALTLTWNDNTTNESGFRVEITDAGGAVVRTDIVPARAGTGQTSFRVTGLTPETGYSFRVQAFTAAQDSAWSPSASATTLAIDSPQTPALVAPTGLTATLSQETNVTLNWTGSAGAEGYHVYYAPAGQSFELLYSVGSGSATTYSTSLDPWTSYSFYVTAYNSQAVSAASNTATITTSGTLAAPSGLTAQALADDQMVLTWTDNSGIYEQAFEFQRKEGAAGAWQSIGTTAANVQEFTDTSLKPQTTYTYQVRATRSTPTTAISDWSNEATGTTLKLARPTGLSAKAVSTSEINLTWSEDVDGEDGFVIEISADDGVTFQPLTTTPPNARHYSAIGLQPKKCYHFRVATSKNGEQSDWSSVASATTHTPPDEDGDGDPTNDPPPPDEPGWYETLGSVTPGIMEESTSSFGSFPAGTYRIVYDGGIVNYSYNRPWYWGGHTYGFTTAGSALAGLPGMLKPTPQEFYDAMEGASSSFTHAGGEISVTFWDSPYDDNRGGGVSWRLERYHPPAPPPEPPVDDPNTTDTDEGPSTISLSVNPEHSVATEGADDYIELVFSRGPGEPGKSRPAVDVYYTLAGTAIPQEDYTGPTPGKGFAAVYKVTIPADTGSTDETNDGVSAVVRIGAAANALFEGPETFFAAIRATGTYLFTSVFVGAMFAADPAVESVTWATFKPSAPPADDWAPNIELDANPGATTQPTQPADGLRIFPDKQKFAESAETAAARKKVWIMVQTKDAPANTPVSVQVWDVDDPSSDTSVDLNDEAGRSTGNDNVRAGGRGEGPFNLQGAVGNDGIARIEWTLPSIMPGNNYQAFASLSPEQLGQVTQEKVDGYAAMPQGVVHSEKLTVWRKLHVEVDSMRATPADAEVGEGDSRIDIQDPDISAFKETFAPAYILPERDTGNDDAETPWHWTFLDDNLWNSYFTGDGGQRGTKESADYWSVYVAGAYELGRVKNPAGTEDLDNDPDNEEGTLGVSSKGKFGYSVIGMEVLRDVSDQWTWTDAEKSAALKWITLHEVGHQFGLGLDHSNPDAAGKPQDVMWVPGPETDEDKVPTVPLRFTGHHIGLIRLGPDMETQ